MPIIFIKYAVLQLVYTDCYQKLRKCVGFWLEF